MSIRRKSSIIKVTVIASAFFLCITTYFFAVFAKNTAQAETNEFYKAEYYENFDAYATAWDTSPFWANSSASVATYNSVAGLYNEFSGNDFAWMKINNTNSVVYFFTPSSTDGGEFVVNGGLQNEEGGGFSFAPGKTYKVMFDLLIDNYDIGKLYGVVEEDDTWETYAGVMADFVEGTGDNAGYSNEAKVECLNPDSQYQKQYKAEFTFESRNNGNNSTLKFMSQTKASENLRASYFSVDNVRIFCKSEGPAPSVAQETDSLELNKDEQASDEIALSTYFSDPLECLSYNVMSEGCVSAEFDGEKITVIPQQKGNGKVKITGSYLQPEGFKELVVTLDYLVVDNAPFQIKNNDTVSFDFFEKDNNEFEIKLSDYFSDKKGLLQFEVKAEDKGVVSLKGVENGLQVNDSFWIVFSKAGKENIFITASQTDSAEKWNVKIEAEAFNSGVDLKLTEKVVNLSLTGQTKVNIKLSDFIEDLEGIMKLDMSAQSDVFSAEKTTENEITVTALKEGNGEIVLTFSDTKGQGLNYTVKIYVEVSGDQNQGYTENVVPDADEGMPVKSVVILCSVIGGCIVLAGIVIWVIRIRRKRK